MSKITISDLQVKPSFDVTDDELCQVQGGLEDGTAVALVMVPTAAALIVAAPVAATVAAGAAVISAGYGIYQALNR